MLKILIGVCFTVTLGVTPEAYAISWDDSGPSISSWEKQEREYHRSGYDSQVNGPHPDAVDQERKAQQRREEETARETAERQRRASDGGNYGGNSAGNYGGNSAGAYCRRYGC